MINQKIKQITSVLVVILLCVFLIIGVMVIWDALDMASAKEIGLKILYTVGGIYALSLLVLLVTNKNDAQK